MGKEGGRKDENKGGERVIFGSKISRLTRKYVGRHREFGAVEVKRRMVYVRNHTLVPTGRFMHINSIMTVFVADIKI